MEKSDKRNTFQYKLREPKLDELRKLGAHLVEDHRDIFKKAYGKLLGILFTKEDTSLILTLAQFYDSALHYFTFQDFLLAHTLEDFGHFLSILVKDQISYTSLDGFPESSLIA